MHGHSYSGLLSKYLINMQHVFINFFSIPIIKVLLHPVLSLILGTFLVKLILSFMILEESYIPHVYQLSEIFYPAHFLGTLDLLKLIENKQCLYGCAKCK